MVTPLDLWIYGRAEPNVSHRRQKGYQTLWRSSGISPRVSENLEVACRCFPMPSLEKDVSSRVQLCVLSNGTFAVTATRAQAPDPRVDVLGRPSFVCVALIFARKTVMSEDFDPFVIADALAEPVDFGAFQSLLGSPGDAVDVSILWTLLRPKTKWAAFSAANGKATAALLEWALDPQVPEKIGRPLYLYGASDDVLGLLREVYFLLPPSRRAQLTFSTAMDGCSEVIDRFNVLGTTRQNHHPRRAKLDLRSGNWISSPPVQSDSAIRFLAYAPRPTLKAASLESSWQAELLLAGQSPTRVPEDYKAVGAYLKAHATEWRSQIVKLCSPLPVGLCCTFCEDLLANLGRDSERDRLLFEALGAKQTTLLDRQLRLWASTRGFFERWMVRILLAVQGR